jgi:hypothetical protein
MNQFVPIDSPTIAVLVGAGVDRVHPLPLYLRLHSTRAERYNYHRGNIGYRANSFARINDIFQRYTPGLDGAGPGHSSSTAVWVTSPLSRCHTWSW